MARMRTRTTALGVALTSALALGAMTTAPSGAEVPTADLSVALTHSPDSVETVEEITFTLTAANAGPATAEDVVVGMRFDYPLDVVDLPEDCTLSQSGPSVVCQLGALTSGASVVSEIVLRAYSSGLYVLPAAVSSPTADPTPADRTTTDSLIVTPGPSQAERYIAGIFPMVLRRDPDAATLAYWADRWKAAYDTYPQRLARTPAALMASDEYRRMRVRDAYQAVLDRAPSAESLTYWVGRLRAGMSHERVAQLLAASAEFRTRHAGSEIDALHRAILGRAATASEVSRGEVELARGVSLGTLAGRLQATTEGRDVIITDRYQRTFGAAPDAFGRFVWQVRLRDGDRPEAIWADLLVSWEVLRRYPFTDDDYTELDLTEEAADLRQDLAAS